MNQTNILNCTNVAAMKGVPNSPAENDVILACLATSPRQR
jgi:hypothetical protein